MIRWTYTDSARRFFPTAIVKLSSPQRLTRTAAAIGVGLAISGGVALAQKMEKGSADHIKAVTSAVDANFIKANTPTSKDWPTIGLDYAETRFSKLNQINAGNVKNLGLKWTYSLELVPRRRGDAAGGRRHHVCQTASWSVVHAIDARTGKNGLDLRSRRQPRDGYKGCCDVVNRGVALYKGKVYVGAYDGRLVALDAVTGKKVWEKDTLIDHDRTPTPSPAHRGS